MRIFYRKEPVELRGITKEATSFGSLSAFLEEYELKSRKSLGRSYRIQTVIGFLLRFTDFASWRRFISFFRIFLFRSFVILLIGVIVYSVTPEALSAPKSVGVAKFEEWSEGKVSSLDISDTDGSLRLQPDGTWNKRVWGVPQADYLGGGFGSGSSSVRIGGDIYITFGSSTRSWFRYSMARDTYETLPELPFPLATGADMGYDGDRTIYLTFGGYAKKFYAYDTVEEAFAELPETPDTICSGSNVEEHDGYVYVNRGCGATDFWRYDTVEREWQNRAPVRATASTGASLVYDEGKLYLSRGSGTKSFYVYDIVTDSWSDKANLPDLPRFSGATLSQNQKGFSYTDSGTGKHYIYYLYAWEGTPSSGPDNGVYSRYSHMVRYDVSANVWELLEASPTNLVSTPSEGSMQFDPDSGLAYVFRGSGTYDLWKFDPSVSQWVGPSIINNGLNSTIGTGSDLIWNRKTGSDSSLYLVRGNGQAQFYRFDVSTNTWTSLANFPATLSTALKGTYADGYVYFFRPGGSTSPNFYRYSVVSNTWSADFELASLPSTVSDGGTLAYNPSDGYIYAFRGSSSSLFYRYDIAANTWTALSGVSAPNLGMSSYGVNVGASLVSDGTDLYATVGNGEKTFLRYSTATSSWTGLSPTPFVQFHGTDMTYADGKIYALAGWYRDETWEYTVATDSWRKVAPIKELSYGRGPYNGASFEYAGGNSFFATLGQGVAEVLSFTPGADSYVASGTYLSQVIDLGDIIAWNGFSKDDSEPSGTDIVYETRTSEDGKNWNGWEEVEGSIVESDQKRYLQVRITLSSVDGSVTPTVSGWEIAYSSEDNPPSNPDSLTAVSGRVGGMALVSGEPYPYTHPYFSWTGADDVGSGVSGYWVYFGTDADADPAIDGSFQETVYYEAHEAMSAGAYHLRIRTVDRNGTLSDGIWSAFEYFYDGVSPALSETRSERVEFENGDRENVSTDLVDGSLTLSPSSGFWNEARLPTLPAYAYNEGKLVKTEYAGNTYFFSIIGYNRPNLYRFDPITSSWTTMTDAPENIYYGGDMAVGPEGFLYVSAGGATPTFMRYDIAKNSWDKVANAPQTFTYGATLAFDGSRYIYATPGGDNSVFRYDTQENRWSTVGTADFDNPEFTYQSLSTGSDVFFDGGTHLYYLQGGALPYFSRYAVADDPATGETAGTWIPLSPAPIGATNGANISYDPEEEAAYYFPGGDRNFFYRYDIPGDSWSRLPDVPTTVGYGGSSVIHGRYLYLQSGASTTYFLRYDLEKDSWETPVRGVFSDPHVWYGSYYGFGGGTAMTTDPDGNAYVIRGAWDTLFQRYDPLTGRSESLAPLPVGSIDGSQIAYSPSEDAVYFIPGSNLTGRRSNGRNNYFFRYDVATNTWASLTNDLPPSQVNTSGVSLISDGSRYLYLTAAGGGATWWRYDTQAASGSRWSSTLPTMSGWTQGTASRLLYKDGDIYSTKGQSTNQFYRFSVSGNTWVRLADIPGTISSGSALIDGQDGYLYLTRGGNTSDYYRYSIAVGTWETLSSIPAQVSYGGGGAGMYAGHRIWAVAGSGTNTISDGLYSYVPGSVSDRVGFVSNGTYESEPIDLLSVYGWANLSVTYDQPEGTFVTVETRVSENGSDWSEWVPATDERRYGDRHFYGVASPEERYFQVRIALSSTDRIYSPEVNDWSVNYYQDVDAPENPTVVSAYSDHTKTSGIVSDTWYAHAAPSFEWPVEGESGGAADNEGGSGIEGYWVYFGTEADADPFVSGDFQTGTSYTASGLTSGETYYLRVKAVDRADMIPADAYAAFSYRYDATAPTSPSDISVTPTGYISVDSYSFLWQDDAVDAHSGIDKLQYRTGGDDPGEWFDISDPLTVSLTIPNAEHLDGAYQSGKNTLSLRVVDMAGNASPPIMQDYYFSASAPSPPKNLTVSPESSSSNSFAFSWEAPESFIGDVAKLRYYYSVNALPTAYNTVETTNAFAGPGPFATQRGPNTFYVVAMDEAENIDYDLYTEVAFEADTSAPPVPANVQAFDTSDRETAEYSVAVKWSIPAGIDEDNFSGYAIFRSLDGTSFEEVATTTGSAYVDTGLESRLYYYYAKSKDRTNNYSIASSVVSLTPTGRYTRPPTLVGEPKYSTQSFAASFTWVTNRVASSFVEYGTSMSLGKTNGQVDSVTDHSVSLNGLSADTKYYYRVKYIDPDGNIGMSDIATFTTLPPPTVSEFTVTDIALESAYVSWKTNASATCALRYGSGSLSMSVEETTGSTSHIQKITGLAAETGYIIQVECVDEDLNEFSSDQYSFSTPVKPIANDIFVSNRENVDLPTVIVEYKTNVPTTTLVMFRHTDEVSPHTYLVSEYATEHRAELAGLDPAKEYTLVIGGADENGIALEPIEQKITTRSDSRPPEILTNRAVGKTVGRGKNSQANLYVKIETNEPTRVRINYAQGVAVSNFEQSTTEDPLNTYHLITIPAEIGQVYSYQAFVTDESENPTTSAVVSVVVEQARETAAEVISGTISSRFGWIGSLWN